MLTTITTFDDDGRPCCDVVGCNAAPTASQWCPNHLRTWRRHGHPLAVGGPRGRTPRLCRHGCGARSLAAGRCIEHHLAWLRAGCPGLVVLADPGTPRPPRGDDQLLADLRDLASSLGSTTLSSTDWARERDRAHTRSAAIYVRRFGSWTAAVEQAGLSTAPIGRPPAQ